MTTHSMTFHHASPIDALIARGVPASRITVLGRAPRAGLELLVSDRAPNAR